MKLMRLSKNRSFAVFHTKRKEHFASSGEIFVLIEIPFRITRINFILMVFYILRYVFWYVRLKFKFSKISFLQIKSGRQYDTSGGREKNYKSLRNE